MERVTLKSSREVLIRPIAADDGPRLRAAYDRLSPQSQYRRFLAPKPHLSSAEARYLVQIDGRDHVALVATRVDDPHFILGVGRFVRLRDDPQEAEVALVVGDPFQREGLASAILDRLRAAAAARGISRFKATMLAENRAAHRLIRKFAAGTADERQVGSVREIELDLAAIELGRAA